MTRYQIYTETELACNYTKPLYKLQYSEIYVEYEEGFDLKTGKLTIKPMATSHSTTDENSCPRKFPKNTGRIGGKKSQDKDSIVYNNCHS